MINRRRLVFLLPLLCTATLFAADEPIDIGSRLEPMFDEHLVEQMTGKAELRMHRPVLREATLVHNEPWEGNVSGYHTVFRDGDVYRLYYRGLNMQALEKGLRKTNAEVTCYAESPDGIHWTKPNLGLFTANGSKENNIIWIGEGTHNFCPFKDENPNCKPDERYKAVGGVQSTGLIAFKSADGVHWSKMQDEPVFTKGAFDSQNVAFWDPTHKRYALYFRFFSGGSLGAGLRLIGESHSDDFLNWVAQRPLAYPGSPDQQMYTNQIHPYYRAPHVLLGFPTRYVARPLTPHVKQLDPVELRTTMTKALGRVGSDLTDGMFMTSRDGLTFRRWDEAFLRPGPQTEGRWMYGDNYQALGLVETASAVAGGPDEISLYSEENSWRTTRRLRRYSIRIDGFVSAQAPLAGGEVITKPLRFDGQSLVINYATSAAGSLRVELQSVDGKPLEGFALADSAEHYGDSITQTVAWKKGTDVSALSKQAVRIRFVLKDADLYSFQFVR